MTDRKILLVTGASSEIGCTLINEIADNYDHVWCHYGNSDAELLKLKERFGDKIHLVQSDFSDINSIEGMIDHIVDTGLLPNNIVHLACNKAYNLQFHKCKWDNYQESIDIGLRSITMILERFIGTMVDDGYGRIVFMLTSYILGGIPPKYQSPYISTKYALYGLMRNLASEYAEYGITVNGVSPDMRETKFLSNISKHVIKMNADKNPLKRNMKVSDVIPVIEYFLSEEAEAVTGQNIGVTGGGEIA